MYKEANLYFQKWAALTTYSTFPYGASIWWEGETLLCPTKNVKMAKKHTSMVKLPKYLTPFAQI